MRRGSGASLIPAVRRPPSDMARPTEPGTARVRHGVCLAVLVLFWAFAMLCLARGHNDRNSDEADGLLEAQDMARGQVFLPGWTVNEDSFYTLYLPVSAGLIRVFGLTSGIIIGVSYAAYLLMGAGAFLAAWRRGVPPLAVALVLFLFLGLLTPFQSFLFFYMMSHTLTIACVLFALAALRWGWRSNQRWRRRGGLLLFSALLFLAVAGNRWRFTCSCCRCWAPSCSPGCGSASGVRARRSPRRRSRRCCWPGGWCIF